MEKKVKFLEGKEHKEDFSELDLDLNANKSHEDPEPEIFATELAYTVTINNSFNTLENLEDELGKKVIHDIPETDPVDKADEELSKTDQTRNFGTVITKDQVYTNFNDNPEAEHEENEIDFNDKYEATDKEKDDNANDNPETRCISDGAVDDNQEDFIGPKPPPLKNQEEKDAFLKEMFAKVDKALENFWPS